MKKREKIKEYLKSSMLNTQSLAHELKISRQNLYDYIKNKSDPALPSAIAMAQLLDIPRKDFIDIFIYGDAINDTYTETE